MKKRQRADGATAYYWVASAVSRDCADYPMKTVRLTGSFEEMSNRCRILSSELRQWMTTRGKGKMPLFDGTVKSLIKVYRETAESPYHGIQHNTRRMYNESLDLLENKVGDRRLSKLTGLDFKRWYSNFMEPAPFSKKQLKKIAEGEIVPLNEPRMRRAYKAMQLVRIIVKFGVVADIPECVRLSIILENMEFSAPAARTKQITFDQAKKVCEQAIKEDRLSIAIAQALQFELTMRQIDVIGRWEPIEPTEDQTGIVDKRQRWSGGLAWSHINSAGILEKVTTKTKQEAVHDTMAYPYLRSVLDQVPAAKRIGPMIIDEGNGLPYRQNHFIKVWRKIADKCGIPRDVFNMDSRAGGVTEGSDAGANIEHLRHHANHSNIATTTRYDRKTLEKTRAVADLRVAHRQPKNASGTPE